MPAEGHLPFAASFNLYGCSKVGYLYFDMSGSVSHPADNAKLPKFIGQWQKGCLQKTGQKQSLCLIIVFEVFCCCWNTEHETLLVSYTLLSMVNSFLFGGRKKNLSFRAICRITLFVEIEGFSMGNGSGSLFTFYHMQKFVPLTLLSLIY